MDFNFNKSVQQEYLHAVRVTLQGPLIVAGLKVPQLDGGILGCGDHVGKYRMEDDPTMNDCQMTEVESQYQTHLVTGARCPVSSYFSGGRGIHSPGDLFSRVGAPELNSFSASFNLLSSSFT